MERYLVTGGAGFIGSHIVEELVKQKKQVRILDNLSTGNRDNVPSFAEGLEFCEGDLRDMPTVRKVMRGISHVFHVGAIRAVGRSVDNPVETTDVNITGTMNVLMAAKEFEVKRVVFSSSSSVYGDTRKFPSQEDDLPMPMSPYAASKIMGEYYCNIFTRLYGLETVSLRYFNVFGPRQNPESKYSALIPIFISSLMRNEIPEVHWDGKQSRDFCYVDNIVHGNLLAMHAQQGVGEVINIATNEEYSVLDILLLLKEMMGRSGARPRFVPKRPGDVRRTYADISKSKKYLNAQMQTPFKKGLALTVKWFLDSKMLEMPRR